MQARIRQLSNRATQNAPLSNRPWVIEFVPGKAEIFSDKLTGWLSSSDMRSEVLLKFKTKEEAVEFAEHNNIKYDLQESKHKRFVKKPYADNFK